MATWPTSNLNYVNELRTFWSIGKLRSIEFIGDAEAGAGLSLNQGCALISEIVILSSGFVRRIDLIRSEALLETKFGI